MSMMMGRPSGLGSMMRGGDWSMRGLGPKERLKTSPWKLLGRLGASIKGYHHLLWLAILCVLGGSALQMLMPWAFKRVIDHTIPSGDARELLIIGVGLAVVQALRYALGYGHRYLTAVVSQQLVYRVAKDLFEHIQRLSLRFFEKWGTGEIISRITNDIQVMQQAVQGGTVMAAVGLVNMLAFAIIMALLNWQLALLVYATVPLLWLASSKTADLLRVRYQRVQEKVADVNNVLQENITGVRVSKAFAREGEQR